MGRKPRIFCNGNHAMLQNKGYLSGALVKEGPIQIVQATVLHLAIMKVVLWHCDLQQTQSQTRMHTALAGP